MPQERPERSFPAGRDGAADGTAGGVTDGPEPRHPRSPFTRFYWTDSKVPTTPTARAFSYALLSLLGLVLTALVLAGHDLPSDRRALGVLVVALPLYLLTKRAGRRRRRSE